ILMAAVQDVREKRHRSIVEHIHSRITRDVFEDARLALAVKPVGQALGLAHVDCVMAVPFNIADAHPAVPENVHVACLVEYCAPVIRVTNQMALKTGTLTEGSSCYVREYNRRTLSCRHFNRSPLCYLPA